MTTDKIYSNPAVSIKAVLDTDERAHALSFIESIMRKRFVCTPPPTHGVIFAAWIGTEIVGSIALSGSDGHELFPIEHHYVFDMDLTPFRFQRELIVQASRWIAIRPGVSLAVLQGSIELAYKLGKRYILIEAKPYSIKRLSELGIQCREIENASLNLQNISAEINDNGMEFYLSSPSPKLYMVELAQLVKSTNNLNSK